MRNLHRLLTIDPPPDSLPRVFMAAWKGPEKPMEVEEQELAGFERSGFAVAEWTALNCMAERCGTVSIQSIRIKETDRHEYQEV